MKNHIYEDKRKPRLLVTVSPKIQQEINDIEYYNKDNTDALYQWYDYIKTLKNYISNPVIAFDNVNRYTHYPNGAVHLVELGFDVTFIVKNNERTNKTYVYIFRIELKPKEFGLDIPTLNEQCFQKRTLIISEFQLRRIIRETLKKFLNVI